MLNNFLICRAQIAVSVLTKLGNFVLRLPENMWGSSGFWTAPPSTNRTTINIEHRIRRAIPDRIRVSETKSLRSAKALCRHFYEAVAEKSPKIILQTIWPLAELQRDLGILTFEFIEISAR